MLSHTWMIVIVIGCLKGNLLCQSFLWFLRSFLRVVGTWHVTCCDDRFCWPLACRIFCAPVWPNGLAACRYRSKNITPSMANKQIVWRLIDNDLPTIIAIVIIDVLCTICHPQSSSKWKETLELLLFPFILPGFAQRWDSGDASGCLLWWVVGTSTCTVHWVSPTSYKDRNIYAFRRWNFMSSFQRRKLHWRLTKNYSQYLQVSLACCPFED